MNEQLTEIDNKILLSIHWIPAKVGNSPSTISFCADGRRAKLLNKVEIICNIVQKCKIKCKDVHTIVV